MGTTKFKQASQTASRISSIATKTGARGSSSFRGFTVIEILVVVTLLTMLALIAIPTFLSARKDSAKSACINNIKEISYATEQWALEKKKGPSSDVTFEDINPYLKGSVVCPAGGTTFENSYLISIVANEPTCLRLPQDHYWLGSTAVAAIQISQSNSGISTMSAPTGGGVTTGAIGGGNDSGVVSGLIGSGTTPPNSAGANGKGNAGNAKGNGKGSAKRGH